jgi:hypothetical protein
MPALVAAEAPAVVMEAVLPVAGLALPSPAPSSAEVAALAAPPACRRAPDAWGP